VYGKVERSPLTDQLEYDQLLDDTGDVDLRAKLAVWRRATTGSGGAPRPTAESRVQEVDATAAANLSTGVS
jgi:hypothetical protein